MKFGSLFSGIGGIDLGLTRAGMECAWQVEIDDYCRRILYKHWPNVPKHRDVKEVGANVLDAVDLIAGGFPCQPFSTAGKRGSHNDDRFLWPEMLRIIKELRPRWVLGENVTGIINLALDQVLSDLEAEAYTCEAFVIPACGVGAWHKRDRVWVVAYSDSVRELQPQRFVENLWGRLGDIPQAVGGEWADEPGVPRVVHGVSHRMDRIKCLGNAVVPQVVTEIGRAIMAV